MNTLIVFLVLGLLFAVILRYLKNGAIRKSASYKLYAVRDDLICLVAENKLAENNRIFQYYYNRINLLLESAPNVGLDDAMDGFLYLQNSKSFEQSLEEAQRRADEMLKLVENESEEVSAVISNYYSASKGMMLAHSSLVRILYIASVKYALPKLLKKLVPKDTCEALKTVYFADNEANQFRRHLIQH